MDGFWRFNYHLLAAYEPIIYQQGQDVQLLLFTVFDEIMWIGLLCV
jgi:hypothetical protein